MMTIARLQLLLLEIAVTQRGRIGYESVAVAVAFVVEAVVVVVDDSDEAAAYKERFHSVKTEAAVHSAGTLHIVADADVAEIAVLGHKRGQHELVVQIGLEQAVVDS
jgi:hypothetical protein